MAIAKAIELLQFFPFSCQEAKGAAESVFLRELIIPFGVSGFVALIEIADSQTVNILAVRHQREEDYHLYRVERPLSEFAANSSDCPLRVYGC